MTKLQEALADARTHTTKGTLLSDEAIDRICAEFLALAEPSAPRPTVQGGPALRVKAHAGSPEIIE